MKLTILTPEVKFFEGEIKAVTVPGAAGRFQVLNNHASLVSALSKGKVSIVKENGEKMDLEISGGFIEVLKNNVAVLAQQIIQA